jgi:purine-cytosine permease-like protein
MYGRWNWRGLAAYFGGFIAMIPFFSTHGFRGPVAAAMGGADLAILVGLPVATVIYLLAYRSFDLEEEIRLIAIADHQLDPDA